MPAVKEDQMTLLNPDLDREEAEETRRGVKMDPELRVIGQMIRTLEELPPPARARVMDYLVSRYDHNPPE